jgi:cell cycle arrest protein BUB3
MTHEVPERVYDMDISEQSQKLVVGLAGRHTEIFDLRKMGDPIQKRESSLKYMTRAVACMHNGTGSLFCRTNVH